MRVRATPSPACRPRVSRFGTYYTKPYALWLAECQRQMAEQHTRTLRGHLECHIDIIVEKPKTTKLTLPRGDVDNYCKGVLDAGTKAGIWGDDSQIEFLGVWKRFALKGEDPGAIITVKEQA